MSFDGLDTDALQLAMQHCDAQSLLALARCGRHTHAAASKPTAWRALSSRPVLLPFAVPFDFSESTESAWARCCRCIPRSSPPVAPQLPPLPQRVADSLQRRPLPSVGFCLSTHSCSSSHAQRHLLDQCGGSLPCRCGAKMAQALFACPICCSRVRCMIGVACVTDPPQSLHLRA
jgi:hypothetical protein